MNEPIRCPHCQRQIDATARLCLYCSYDLELGVAPRGAPIQAEVPTAAPPAVAGAPPVSRVMPSPRPGTDPRVLRLLVITAIAALLIATFAIGGLVYGLGKREKSTKDVVRETGQTGQSHELSDLTLVADSDPTETIGRVITSSPVPDPDHKIPEEFQRSDATALPSGEYSRIIEETHKVAKPTAASVDPLSIVVKPPAELPAIDRPEKPPGVTEPRPAENRSGESGQRTRPVPLRQPLPKFRDVKRGGTVRLSLTIGRDGRVQEVNVIESTPGLTAPMISAVQRWQFRPATLNGQPVVGTFPVEITVKAEDD